MYLLKPTNDRSARFQSRYLQLKADMTSVIGLFEIR